MTNCLIFVVPGKPVPQERPIVVRRGWTLDPPRSRNEKKRIGHLALMARQKHKLAIFGGDLEMSMAFFGLNPLADISNAVKLVEDALNKVAYHDDKQIHLLKAERFKCLKGEERTEVILVQRTAGSSSAG